MKDKKSKSFIIYTPDYAKDKPGLKIFAIYPDYWGENIKLESSFRSASGKTIKYKSKHNWGEVPCFGYVKEQDEYWATYAAYTADIVPSNATFGLRAVEIKTKFPDPIKRRTYGKPRRMPNK